jgi:CRP-like cAMP-binding protein
VLANGKVKLTQVTPDGQQIIMGYIVPGREFGLLAALEDKIYPVSAEAVGPCLAFAWDPGPFNELMNSIPQIAVNGLGIFAKRIEGFQNRVRELATQRVERRIARTVLRLAQQTGKKTVSGVLIDMPISRQDLAEMNGTTLYTVSRTLKNWESQGLILSKREQIIILFPHGIVRIAEDLPISKSDLELKDE